MKQESSRLYLAEEGKTIRRKEDNFNMGTGICLGESDSIDNYYEDDMTEEELAEYEASKPKVPEHPHHKDTISKFKTIRQLLNAQNH